jgi:hypothetical protein
MSIHALLAKQHSTSKDKQAGHRKPLALVCVCELQHQRKQLKLTAVLILP